MPDELLSAAEVAELLQVADETVRRWAAADRLPHIRYPSGQIRFRRADIEAILNPPVAS
jgi:excisionase family DNA binding protein